MSHRIVVALTLLSTTVASTPLSADTGLNSNIVASIIDVSLGPNGTLTGQVVDEQGNAEEKQLVVVRQQNRVVAYTQSGPDGVFAISGLQTGMFHVTTDSGGKVCRFWTEKIAPPSATRDLLLITGSTVERGQRPIGEMISNPILVGLIIAAAVAIPVAVHNSKDDASGS